MILFLPFFPPHADTSNSSPSHFKVIHYFPPSLICGVFPDGSVGKESTCSAGDTGDMVRSLGGEDRLEKEMATHSSILAWEIAWAEEPGGLQSVGSRRMRQD